jgi:hypothetical protein
MTENVLVYGNCQAGVFAQVPQTLLNGDYSVWHIMSFAHPTEPPVTVSQQELDTVKLVLEQVDAGRPMAESLGAKIPETASIVRFPPLDFNLLWPFNFNDPRNISEPPDYPFGRFPYGDRIVVELLREGLAGSALWDAYCDRSIARLPDLVRLRAHERTRLTARDGESDVKMAELLMSEFTCKRLFWTVNHPTGWLLGKLLGEVLALCQSSLRIDGDVRLKAESIFRDYEPFDALAVPIHPEVANQLKLRWWNSDQVYRYLDGSTRTLRDQCVDTSTSGTRGLQAPSKPYANRS